MKRIAILMCGVLLATALAAGAQQWPQWGQNSRHTGTSTAVGQSANNILDEVTFDTHAAEEQNDPLTTPDLLVHYQAPLIDGNDVYMELKTGTYTSITSWETQIWNEERLRWQGGHL